MDREGAADTLTTAVRVFAVRVPVDGPSRTTRPRTASTARPRRLRRGLPVEVLIVDLETDVGPTQRPLVGCAYLYRDPPEGPPARTLVEEMLINADDLVMRDPPAFRQLERYVATHEASTAPGFSRTLGLVSVSTWLEDYLFRYGYRHRDRCSVVGFHIGFDLGALASYWGEAEGYQRGGFSLGLWGHLDAGGRWHDTRYHPRLRLRAIDSRRTLFDWGALDREDADRLGRINNVVDLRTLSFALTDRSLTLEGACAAFGDPYPKRDVTYGVIDEPMLDYVREDVAHTAELYRRCLAELAEHPGIDLPPARLYSPATVGTRYFEAMGLRRPLESFTDFTPEELGWREAGRG